MSSNKRFIWATTFPGLVGIFLKIKHLICFLLKFEYENCILWNASRKSNNFEQYLVSILLGIDVQIKVL